MLLWEQCCHCCLIRYRGIGLQSRTHEGWRDREEEHDSSKLNSFLSFVHLFVAALCLCCCTRAFSSFDEPGLLSTCGLRAAHCSGFSCFEAWPLGVQASVVVEHGLSYPAACGIFLDQGSNPCLLHWRVDSLPLSY